MKASKHEMKAHGITDAMKAPGFKKGGGTKKMKKGGPTGMDMRKFGRNLARAMNQRGR